MPIDILNENVYEAGIEGWFDLIVVDPPFGDSNDNFLALYSKLGNLAKENASIFVFTDWQNSYRVQSIISRKTEWIQHDEIIWIRTVSGKNGSKPVKGYKKILHYAGKTKKASRKANDNNVWCYEEDSIGLADRLILSHSNEGDSVLDCFAGSGTFACSSKMQNRNYLGFEIDPERSKTILERVERLRNPEVKPHMEPDSPEIEIF